VKVVCGTVTTDQGRAGAIPVAPGRYWTAINIHNPDKCREACFRWKVAIALPGKPGAISAYQSLTLGPDAALEIDCDLMAKVFPPRPPPPSFGKGFAVIESDIELDVVAVYTAAQSTTTPVTSFSTERVQPRCVPVCEDLVLPINTGVADWQTLSTPAGALPTPQPVVVLAGLPTPWKPPPSGSVWVSSTASDSSNAAAGNYTYQLTFELCSGFSNPVLQLQGLVDNTATVSLNNNPPFGSLSVYGASPPYPTLSPPAAQFQPGANVLTVALINAPGASPNPTGFAIAGLLQVASGRCPCSKLPLLPPRPSPIG
jgi:hypothetical protein